MDVLTRLSHRYSFVRSMAEPALAIRRRYLAQMADKRMQPVNRLRTMIRGDIVVNVPEFDGSFAMSPQSDLFARLFLDDVYEPELTALALASLAPPRDVIDIGANIGFFTVAMAKRLHHGKVLAVEPNPKAYSRLMTNIAGNETKNVITYEGAVADVPGTLDLNFVEGREEYSSLGNLTHPSVADARKSSTKVPVKRLDDLVAEYNLNPAFIKIDVEGAEHLVIGGALETLRKYRPTILAECSDPLLRSNGSSSNAVIEMIRRAGYTVKDALHPELAPGARTFCDILCTPT